MSTDRCWRARAVALRDQALRGSSDLWRAVLQPERSAESDAEIARQARDAAAVVWLLGKVQSGKSSIVRTITQATASEVGNGFKACTKTARLFDFPPEAPVIRFLDTRGLGEVDYDPAEDMAFCEERAHLLLVVMRAMDPQQDGIVAAVRQIRRRHPSWPIVVAQTALHEGYAAGADHAIPYPFAPGLGADGLPAAEINPDLLRALNYQRHLFDDLPGSAEIAFVPIDFTLAEDGYHPADFGLEQFSRALAKAAPAGLAGVLEAAAAADYDRYAARAHPHIMGYATAAAAADIVPVAGLVAVPGIQAKLLHSVAEIYGVDWNRAVLREFAGGLGAGLLARLAAGFGLRELAKLVPVYGQTVGTAGAAATSFATTIALGKAACYFLRLKRRGQRDDAGVSKAYREALLRALKLAAEKPPAAPEQGGQK